MLHNVNAVSATTAANVADQQVIDVIGVSAEERLVKLRWSQVFYALKLQQNKHNVRLERKSIIYEFCNPASETSGASALLATIIKWNWRPHNAVC